jgi:aspartate ammonia-lyase
VLHPNEDVNLRQSTNDVYPTALKIATYMGIVQLVHSMGVLRASFERKAAEFHNDLKMGRTQLQDAVPMTLGQEFSTFAVMLGEDEERLKEASTLICEINLGATAIGTGINASPEYAPLACRHLAVITGIPVTTSPNLVEATQDVGSFVPLSGAEARSSQALQDVQ